MNLTEIIQKKLLKRRNSRSVSRSDADAPSFSSHTTASSSDAFRNGRSTPTSVLPPEISPEELPEIPAEVYLELKQAFEMIDRDGDGKIEKKELERLLCRLGDDPDSKEEIDLMLKEVDKDNDGCISLQEFYAIGSAFAPPACDCELRETFDFFDTDHDGKITAEELFSVYRTIGDQRCTLEDCRRMIGVVNNNGEGFVCFEDFCRMMDPQQI